MNTSNYKPLLSSSYIQLPKKLRNPKIALIHIKNIDHKCFLWCHIRLKYSTDIHPERINKEDNKNRC